VLLPLEFVLMQKFSKIFTAMANLWRNTLLKLHYPTVLRTVFCSYLGTILTNGKELIPDILKIITN
jgi:hypothetical protein